MTIEFAMFRKALLPVILLPILASAPLAAAGKNVVQGLTAAGEILPFEVLLDRVKANVRGEYVGAEFVEQNRSYRFRFVNGGVLFNVDVDARTGQRINRRQPY